MRKDNQRFASVRMCLIHVYNCHLSGLTDDNLKSGACHGETRHLCMCPHAQSSRGMMGPDRH